jgi:hypothetical protein
MPGPTASHHRSSFARSRSVLGPIQMMDGVDGDEMTCRQGARRAPADSSVIRGWWTHAVAVIANAARMALAARVPLTAATDG